MGMPNRDNFGYDYRAHIHKAFIISRYGCGSSLSNDLMAADFQEDECTLVFTARSSNTLIKSLHYL